MLSNVRDFLAQEPTGGNFAEARDHVNVRRRMAAFAQSKNRHDLVASIALAQKFE
jgi:hypothetical protein